MVDAETLDGRKFTYGDVARMWMIWWYITEEEVEAAVLDPDGESEQDESGVRKVWAAQTRDFTITVHYFVPESGPIEVRLAYGTLW